jgi:ferredoxin, 2Fe-2S
MAKITWKLANGSTISADVNDGTNLMLAAVANNVTGVVGECGGCLSCATCHVYVDESWSDRAGKPGDIEDAMLEITEAPKTEFSRLSCQIVASTALDGLVLSVPQG